MTDDDGDDDDDDDDDALPGDGNWRGLDSWLGGMGGHCAAA